MTLPPLDPVLSPASPQARALSELFTSTLVVCAAIFVIVVGTVAWCLVRFRGRAATEPRQVEGNTKLEVGWTLGSIAVLIVLFALTVRAMAVADPPAERDADITVIGHQWWWEVHYSNGTIVAANEIHIPTATDVLVRVEAADVIHSFWVPELGRKMDAIPGHPNQLWLRADAAGEFLGTCAEFCGAQHAGMRLLVVAQPAREFDTWLVAQTRPASEPDTDAARRGEHVFLDHTCATCHAVRGIDAPVAIGPDLTHVATRETLAAGVLPDDDLDLRRWLTDPQAVKPGCHMPDFHLTASEIDDLAAFLETLR